MSNWARMSVIVSASSTRGSEAICEGGRRGWIGTRILTAEKSRLQAIQTGQIDERETVTITNSTKQSEETIYEGTVAAFCSHELEVFAL
jgi:hypothetical protein